MLLVSQPGQLSLPFLLGRKIRSNPCIYMDYGGGDHLSGILGLRAAVWLRRSCVKAWPAVAWA